MAFHLAVTRRSMREHAALLAASLGGFVVPFCALYSLYLLVIGGDHFEFRLADPIVPFLFFGAAVLTMPRPADRPANAVTAGAVAGLLLVSAGTSSLMGFSDFDRLVTFGGNTQYVSIVSVETEAGFLQRWERIGR